MVRKNMYRRKINGRSYYVRISEGFLYTVVAVRSGRSRHSNTYMKKRMIFCDDVESLAAEALSCAVEKREQSIKESNEYDNRMKRVLEIVEGEYDK